MSKPRALEEIAEWFNRRSEIPLDEILAALREAAEGRDMEWTRTLGIGGNTPVTPEWAREAQAMVNRDFVARVAELERKLAEERACHDCREYRENMQRRLDAVIAEWRGRGLKTGKWEELRAKVAG